MLKIPVEHIQATERQTQATEGLVPCEQYKPNITYNRYLKYFTFTNMLIHLNWKNWCSIYVVFQWDISVIWPFAWFMIWIICLLESGWIFWQNQYGQSLSSGVKVSSPNHLRMKLDGWTDNCEIRKIHNRGKIKSQTTHLMIVWICNYQQILLHQCYT